MLCHCRATFLKKWGVPLKGVCGAMLDGACMILGNRYIYTILLDNSPISSEWGLRIFSLSMVGHCKR